MYVTSVPASGQPSNLPVNGAAISGTGISSGNWVPKPSTYTTYQLVADAAATVVIEATNDPATASGVANNAVLLGTITLAAAGSDGFVTGSDWRWNRARITAFGGTSARVYMGA